MDNNKDIVDYYRKKIIDLLEEMEIDESDLKFWANIFMIIKAHNEKKED